MNVINMNRNSVAGQIATRKRRLEDEVQRLKTFNTLALDTLRELYEFRLAFPSKLPQGSMNWCHEKALTAKVKKVLS